MKKFLLLLLLAPSLMYGAVSSADEVAKARPADEPPAYLVDRAKAMRWFLHWKDSHSDIEKKWFWGFVDDFDTAKGIFAGGYAHRLKWTCRSKWTHKHNDFHELVIAHVNPYFSVFKYNRSALATLCYDVPDSLVEVVAAMINERVQPFGLNALDVALEYGDPGAVINLLHAGGKVTDAHLAAYPDHVAVGGVIRRYLEEEKREEKRRSQAVEGSSCAIQ